MCTISKKREVQTVTEHSTTAERPEVPAGATPDALLGGEEFFAPLAREELRGQFTRDNQAATFKTTAAVIAAAALNLLYEMDTDQVQQILSLLAGKVGLPLLVPAGVALFEFWRRDR